MRMRTWITIIAVSLFLSLLAGCDGMIIDGSSSDRDSAVTNSIGEAYLQYGYRSETVTVRNSSTDAPLRNIQVLGLTDGDESLYVAADPNFGYHPAITSGESSSSYRSRVYLTPVDQRLGTNATSYHSVDGGLLERLSEEYGSLERYTTVGNLRDTLASLAYGNSAGLVVCLDQPLYSNLGSISATEIAQRSSNLSSAFQAIGWQYIFTSRGFSTNQSLNVWVIDPYYLRIASGSSGALNDTLIAVVAPTTDSTGPVLSGSLKVELTWNAPVDLDLHLVRDEANLYDPYDDCFWKYLEQDWGESYRTTDNPRLLYDNESGYGPEMIVLDEMTSGEKYSVVVDYWGDLNGDPTYIPTTATVRVWTNGGSTPRVFTVTGLDYGAPESGEYRVVCNIDGRTGDVTLANRSVTRQATRSLGSKRDKAN